MSEEKKQDKLPVHAGVMEISQPGVIRDTYLVGIRTPGEWTEDPLTPELFGQFARSDAGVEINFRASAGQATTDAVVEIATLAGRRVRQVHFPPSFGSSGEEMCTVLHAIVAACDPDRQIVVHTHTRDHFDMDFKQVPARVDMVFDRDLKDSGYEKVVMHRTQQGSVYGYVQTGPQNPFCLSNVLTEKWKIFAAERAKASQ